MSKAPAFQLYAGDLLTDVMDWTDEQVGVHIRLLCWSWVNRKGIPRDTRRLTRIAPGAVDAWHVVGTKWVEGPDDTWVNNKLEGTRTSSEAFRASQREKSLLAVAARAEKKASKRSSNNNPTGVPVGNPLEDEDEVEDTLSSGKERVRKGPDPNITAVIDHLTAALQTAGIAQSLDGTVKDNRYAAQTLLNKLAKDYPQFQPLDSAKHLIDAAMVDEFHRRNSTSVRYVLNNCGKIAAASKARKQQTKNLTSDEYGKAVAEAAAQRLRDRANAA